MAGMTEKELVERTDGNIDEADRRTEEVREIAEDSETVADIASHQGEAVYREQEDQLRQLNSELGDIVMQGIEAAAEQVEAQHEVMSNYERDLEEATDNETRAAEEIEAGRSRVKNKRLEEGLADQQKVREEGARVLEGEQQRTERKRTESERVVEDLKEKGRNIRQGLKNLF